jgi:hypothetical protein
LHYAVRDHFITGGGTYADNVPLFRCHFNIQSVNIFQPFQSQTLTFGSTDMTKPPGLTNYLALISQRAKIEGFIVYIPSLPFYPFSCPL